MKTLKAAGCGLSHSTLHKLQGVQQTEGDGSGGTSAESVQIFDISTSRYAMLTVATVCWARV